MKNVMVRAWEIAKEGQVKFGGSVREYFAAALKMAWAESRKAEIVTSSGSRKHKSWVAKINGTCPRYKFSRTFLTEKDDEWADKTFVVTDGIYNVCDAGEQSFVKVAAGKAEKIEAYEVSELVA